MSKDSSPSVKATVFTFSVIRAVALPLRAFMTSKVGKQSKQQEAYGLPGTASHHLEQDSAWKQ